MASSVKVTIIFSFVVTGGKDIIEPGRKTWQAQTLAFLSGASVAKKKKKGFYQCLKKLFSSTLTAESLRSKTDWEETNT